MAKNKKLLKIILLIIGSGTIIAGALGFYLFNMPHRDVQATKTDYKISSSELTKQYLTDPESSNEIYLDEEGESKIIAVTGNVYSINKDQKDQLVVLLKNENEKVGVSCTFMASTNSNAEKLELGSSVTIKGVIRSGAGFDEDLGLYEDVIMEKCDIIN